MQNRLTDEELRHSVNEALLEEAAKIKGEERLLRERLQKLEANRQGISESVYQRVRSDYLTKLGGVNQKFETLRKGLDAELAAVTEKKLLVDEELRHRRDQMEEAKLRHSLGEYPKEEFEKLIRQDGEEVKRLEAALKELTGSLNRLEAVLPRQPAAAPAAPAAPERPAASITEKPAVTFDVTPKVQPKPTHAPQLAVMEGGKVSQTIAVEKNLQIGRSPTNDVVLKDPKVSRQHAQIQIMGEKYVLLDMESSNGTYVRGKKIHEQILSPGDEIRIGKSTLVFKG